MRVLMDQLGIERSENAYRLPPVGGFIWEPAEGSALFDPRPEVGELAWRRKSTLLAAEAVFPDLGPPNQCYPTNNYRVTCQLRSGQEVLTAELRGGPVGGFSEARPNDSLELLASLAAPPHELELFHQLILSAIRRLKRGEHALAVLDAQSAFETMVAALLVECLTAAGRTSQQIDAAMGVGGQFHTLQRRLQELDRVSVAQAAPPAQPLRFLTSPEEVQWRAALYGLRNRIVHAGVREVSFPDAKAALVAGLQAIQRVQSLTPAFNRSLMWSRSTRH